MEVEGMDRVSCCQAMLLPWSEDASKSLNPADFVGHTELMNMFSLSTPMLI